MMNAYMKKYITALLLAITFIPLPAFAGEKNKKCLEYEPSVVEIAGTLEERTFCCEDWILENKGPFTYWVVEPVKPICVNASEDDPFSDEEYNVEALQLLAFSIKDMYERYKHFVSEKVIVTGILSHRTTGHHRTRVMIDVKSIKPVKKDK